jgi:penicillin V acylase-like amidase (Ntn superfamily)
MKNTSRILVPILALGILGGAIYFTMAWISPPAPRPFGARAPSSSTELLSPSPGGLLADPDGACTALCLNNGDHCVFGANQDNTLEIGLLFVNKRHVLRTTWDPSTSGEYARWTSRYGSVTINLVGYQMPWAGMNEAGLMISTMSMPETRGPTPDERPPFQGPFWMQYQLDTHSTVEEVIAGDAEVRLVESTVDHYLVCDRTGACATIEFLEGGLVYHTGESLPVAALTNSTYQDSVSAWEETLLQGSQPEDNSLWRFAVAASRVRAFQPSSSDEAVAYAFDTLAAVSREDTVWSFVFDPVNLRLHFRTNHNPNARYLNLSDVDFSCRTPVRLLDVHADVSGDIHDELVDYTHGASYAHSTIFFTQYEGFTQPPFLVDTLLWGLESSPCQADDASTQADLVRYHPLLPPTVTWAGLSILHRVGPFWVPLVGLSLAIVIWRMALGHPSTLGRRLAWALATIILGPIGLLAYVFAQRKKRHGVNPS